MITERSHDGAGWAQFSDDRKHRYVIGRLVSTRALEPMVLRIPDDIVAPITKVVFVMLNPSVAGAHKPDPTWTTCCKFGQRWGADVVEAVNLDSLISTDPKALWAHPIGQRGDDEINNQIILDVCGAKLTAAERFYVRVVAAWGRPGARDNRAGEVCAMLAAHDIALYRFDVPCSDNGQPRHPLARGTHRIPDDTKAVPW